MAEDYYGILGVPRDATTQEIKRAFRQIARECHPDVSGGDAAAEERFKSARQAYETLMDPVTRARYDRRGQRRKWGASGGSFFDAFYRASGGEQAAGATGVRPDPDAGRASKVTGGGPRGQKTGRHNPGNDVSLDDLFGGDFGFGSNERPRARPGAASAPPPDRGPSTAPQPGEDVRIDLDVPADVAERGGSVTAVYYRMQRADSWRPGAADPGLVRIQDIADVRIIPGTREGTVLRERGLGNAGAWGGPYGDLVATVRVVSARSRQRPPPPPPEPEVDGDEATMFVDVSVVEAMLGGRVQLDTPQGSVKLTIPPGTSGGTRMRLKGRGPRGPGGQPTDLYVVTRIRVPRELDEESRRLIEAFARLNPT